LRRREFIETLGLATAATILPRTEAAEPALQVVRSSARSASLFPHISRPQLVNINGSAGILCHSDSNTFWSYGKKQTSLGPLMGARAVSGPDGEVHCVGWRGTDLVHARLAQFRPPKMERFATKAKLHPAVGLDAVSLDGQVLAVAPGVGGRSLALYTSDGSPPRPITHSRWAHPLLAFDASRRILHLVFSPWADLSSLYSTIVYLRSADLGKTWTKSDGSPLATPFKPAPPEHGGIDVRPEILSVQGQPAGGFAHTLAHCLALDPAGNPHVLYSFCRPYFVAGGEAAEKSKREPRMRTMLVRWTGTDWMSSELSADFAVDVAGGSLAWDSDGKLHALVMFKDKEAHWLDLGHTSSRDGGKTWMTIESVTSDAAVREQHYLAPSMISTADGFDFVCTSINERKRSSVFRGSLKS
jgi:hypothetical protein